MLLIAALLVFHDRARGLFGGLSGEQLLFIIVAVLVVADLGLFAAAMACFQRSRLMLD